MPAAPIAQLPACATVVDEPSPVVVPYSTVLLPATSVHHSIDIVVVIASGFWMSGPRVSVCAEAGAAGSTTNVFELPAMNHRVDVFGGVLMEECSALLSEFFAARRKVLT